MIFSINKTTHYILALSKQAPQGFVHSVYRKTINLSFTFKRLSAQRLALHFYLRIIFESI